jgi:putative transposon-encoded protein
MMARKIELKKEELILKDSQIEGFLERVVTPFGTSAKADVPRKYIGRRVYVIITKSDAE